MTSVRELTADDAAALVDLYDQYEWWDDRTVADVRAALRETEVAMGVSDGRGAGDRDLVAGARVLTDYRYYATVYDVIVARDRRGEGLGERLLSALLDHPDLQALPGLSLLCRRGLVPFYESVGFEEYGGDVEVPQGGTEELVRMTYQHDGG